MSWYSVIYIYVRNVQTRRPIYGYFLHFLLNSLLILQTICLAYSYYVYVFVVCGEMLTNYVQICIYLAIYHSLLLMMLWSLLVTSLTSVTRIPEQYFVDADTDLQLKAVTPSEDGRFYPDKSNVEQIAKQKKVLEEWVSRKCLSFVETDNVGRYRYCYVCCVMKPDRAHHCSSCGFCVVRFDHHCPWINKCICWGNYKSFCLYIFYTSALILFSLVTSLEALIRYFVNGNWIGELDECLQILLCMIVHSTFGVYPIGDLLRYHFQLITVNETTCEQVRPPIIRGDPSASYNFGAMKNIREVFGWGLWMFPVWTPVGDGVHFAVHYSDKCDVKEKRRLLAVINDQRSRSSLYRNDELRSPSTETVRSKTNSFFGK